MEIFNLTKFFNDITDNLKENESITITESFNGNTIEAIRHYTDNYMGSPINNLLITFTPADAQYDYDRKMWERKADERTRHKITNAHVKMLKTSIEKYLTKNNIPFI